MPRRPAPFTCIAVLAAAAALLSACGQFETDELTARTTAAQPGVNCSSCHSLSLKDSNHVFHLFETGNDWSINGPITCLDCHANSVKHRPVQVFDSLFLDSTGNRWSSLDFPIVPGRPSLGDTIRAWPLDSIAVHTVNAPVEAPPRPGPPPPDGLVEWLTGKAHLNGAVDVDFDPRVSDTAEFAGAFATFNREQETCSNVACHPSGEKPWRFASPSKGLPGQKF